MLVRVKRLIIRCLMPAKPRLGAWRAGQLEPAPPVEVVDAEIVDEQGVEPPRKDLVLLGRAALADVTRDPDDWVHPETDEELKAGIPKNTRAALEYQWGRWIWWCGKTGRQHLPARPDSIRQYIVEHWDMVDKHGRKRGRDGQPYAPQTVQQAVYLISTVHQWFGYATPTRHPKVQRQLQRYEEKWKAAGFRTGESYALSPAESVRVARMCNLTTVNGLRAACAFRLQYDTGARASEILGLRLKDVRWEADGRAVLHFAQTKTHDSRDVAVEAVPDVDGDVDPALLLSRWIDVLAEAGFTEPDGWLFRQVYASVGRKDGQMSGTVRPEPWDYSDYELTFVRYVRKAGVNVGPKGELRVVTSHSNRAGLITAAVDEGVPLEKVARRTGHSPASPVIHRYYRTGRRWGADNAGVVVRGGRKPPQ